MNVYLAGGFYSGWQDRVKQEAPQHDYYDPRVDTDQLRNFNIAQQDFAGVDWSNLVFAYFERDNPSGIGLALEVGFAVARYKRVIIIDNHDRLHGFLATCGERIYTNLDSAIAYLREVE